MARNSTTLAVQECAPKPPSTSTVCFCSTAAAKLSYFQIMCTGDLTQSSTKQFIFMLKHRPTIKCVCCGGIVSTCHTHMLCRGHLWVYSEAGTFVLWILCVRLDKLCYFIFIVLLWRGEESGAEVSRAGVFKKYSSSINRPCAAAELILRSVHKAPCFSQHCTNSGIIMVLLVGRGRNDTEGMLAEKWE